MAFSYKDYTGDGVTDTFTITFTYQDTNEISVTVDGVAETGLTFPSTTTVQLTSAPASDALVRVRRTTSLTSRSVDFASGSVLTEEDLDNSNIQVFHAAQEAIDTSNDGITLADDDKWDAQSKIIKNVATPTSDNDASTKAYVDTVAGSASAAAASASAAATSATAAATSETNAASSASAASSSASSASGSATTATSQASAASTSASNAATSETNAATSETNAANSAAAAATSASNAATSETNAETAKTAAEAAQAAAELALDNFEDTYLGAFASDPTTDNDGDALTTGDLYFNTGSNDLRVYNGSAWQIAAVSAAGLLAAANNLSDVADVPTARTNLGLGTAATTASTDYATAAQGALADSALQSFTETNDLTAAVTWANVPDANITQSSVTQHQAALSITESQISDFGTYETADADILKADTADTLTASFRGTVTTDNDLSFDMNATNNFKCTPTSGAALTFTNITAGQSGNIWLDNSAGVTITAAATTYISAADLTTIATAGVYFMSYYSDGTNVAVSVTQAITGAGA